MNLKNHPSPGKLGGDETTKVHVKAPWLREVFNNPNVIRKSKDTEEMYPSNYSLNFHRETQRMNIIREFITPAFLSEIHILSSNVALEFFYA